nr:GNAT family N-acetyltransferase [Bifidobacterium amazonense]
MVQKLIHNSPVYHEKDCWIRVGVDDETGGLASYCAVVHRGDGVYEIALIAVSRRLRGLGLGTQALRDAMATATRNAVQRGLDPAFVATIDEDNRASAHLFASFGYQLMRTYERDRHGFVFNLWARR